MNIQSVFNDLVDLWWQETAARFLNDCLTHLNAARSHDDELDRCDSLFDALNKTWTNYYLYQKRHKLLLHLEPGSSNRSDNRELHELLLSGLGANGYIELCQSTEVRRLCEFVPQVMNHDTLRAADYEPANISEQLCKKARDEHNQLFNAYKRFSDNRDEDGLRLALIKKLAQILYVVRSNIKHGEKTPKGPDILKYDRDVAVCVVVNPVLELIFDILWKYPNRRLASYGTLRPGQSNYSVVSSIAGEWLPGTISGNLTEVHGCPMFRWSVQGNKVPVEMLLADELPSHWDRLDRFEGADYQRILVPVETSKGLVVANLYNARSA